MDESEGNDWCEHFFNDLTILFNGAFAAVCRLKSTDVSLKLLIMNGCIFLNTQTLNESYFIYYYNENIIDSLSMIFKKK